MEKVYFRKNGNIYHFESGGLSAPAEERLQFKVNNVWTVPAMSTQSPAIYGGKDFLGRKVYYNTSSPTIAFRKNGTTYYCSKVIKYAGLTSGSIVSTSVSSIRLSSNWYEKDITVNYKLSISSQSSSGVSSPKYRLSHAVVTNEGLSYNSYGSGDPFYGTTQNASYSSVLEIVANGGNSSAKLVIRFELWDDLNKNLIDSTNVTINGGWTWSDSSGGGGGSGGE